MREEVCFGISNQNFIMFFLLKLSIELLMIKIYTKTLHPYQKFLDTSIQNYVKMKEKQISTFRLAQRKAIWCNVVR